MKSCTVHRYRLTLSVLGLIASVASLAGAEASYSERVAELQPDDGAAHYGLAIWCRQHGDFERYKEWLQKTIAIEPDHAAARQLLGYEQVDGAWLRGPELKQAQGLVLHEGRWIPAADKKKIAQGLIEYRGDWLTPKDYYERKGYVRYLGGWVSKNRHKRIQRRQQRLAEIIQQRSQWSQAWQFKTRAFEVTTNCSPQVAREIGEAMDECYTALAKVFNIGSSGRVPLEIFASQQQFMEHSAKQGLEVGSNTLGYFYWSSRHHGIRCFYAGSVAMTLKTLYHECTHLAIHSAVRNGHVPTWSNEGLAVFFEDAQRGAGGFDLLTIPWHRLWNLQHRLQRDPDSVSLERLVNLGPQEYTGEYYPQGWSLIYFLLFADDGKYRRAFGSYYDLLTNRQGRQLRLGNSELFHQAFGQAPLDFQRDWRRFIESLHPETPEQFRAAAITAVTNSIDFDAAIGFAEQALDEEPDEWQSHATMARVLLHHGLVSRNQAQAAERFAGALQHFDQAIDRGRLDRIRQRRGLSLLSQVDLHIDHARACLHTGEHERAGEILEAVLEVDETSALAYAYLALLYGVVVPAEERTLDHAFDLIAIAKDFSRHHQVLAVEARLELARGNSQAAARLYQQARAADPFGFGALRYAIELRRLQQGRAD